MADPFLRSPKNPHFFQPLLPGFQSHLKIPVKFFSNHIEGKHEGKTMNLISDASERTWKVKMEGQRLTCGWKEFVETHDLRIGDVVIFRHEGDMLFHVTFLGPSCCEIQYSKNKEEESDEIGKEQNPETEANSFSLDQSCFIANVTDGSLREDRLFSTLQFLPRKLSKSNVLKKGTNEIVLMNEGLSKWTFNLFFRESSQTFYVRLGWRSFCADNGFELGDSIIFKPESNNTKIPLLRFSKSDDRIVILTIESTSLRSCKSYLPVRFTRRNKMKKAGGKKINMLDKNGVKWPVSLLIEKVSRRMCLGSGLKDFVDAVGIKAYESFVLELVWEDKTSPPVLKFCYKIKNGP